jgi:hypothetical protein
MREKVFSSVGNVTDPSLSVAGIIPRASKKHVNSSIYRRSIKDISRLISPEWQLFDAFWAPNFKEILK